MLSIGIWMKLYRLERFPRHLVISFQFLPSPAPWKLLLLVVNGEQEWEKCNSEKLDLCVHELSVGYWNFYEYPFGKLTPTKKDVQYFCHCRIFFCCGICLAWWGEGTSNQKALYGFPCPSSVPVCPTPVCCSPRGLHHSWELLEHDWLVISPVQPKMPERLGTDVRAGTWEPSPGK